MSEKQGIPIHPPSYPEVPEVPAPSYPGTSSQMRVCCISINGMDKLRLIATPRELTLPVRQAIEGSWGPVQRETVLNNAHEFKLLGNPWLGHGPASVKSRKVITAVLKTMAIHGWNIIQSTDVSKRESDKDTLYFESVVAPDAAQVEMFSMSFNWMDRIRLIEPPTHIVTVIRETIISSWTPGICQEQDYHESHEFKLNGKPFWPNSEETITARIMLGQVLVALRAHGFKLYTSVDINVGKDGRDVETWILRRSE
ncbi:hypothetical protein BGZ46_009821 [Entomortierella lignicola]|nr:hypothetical protein BGZ46_009821 [Entomortierella lignicola]